METARPQVIAARQVRVRTGARAGPGRVKPDLRRQGDVQVRDRHRPTLLRVTQDEPIRRHGAGLVLQQIRSSRIGQPQALCTKMCGDRLVLHLDVQALLVPVDQSLQGRRQIAVGGQNRDQLADAELALKASRPPTA